MDLIRRETSFNQGSKSTISSFAPLEPVGADLFKKYLYHQHVYRISVMVHLILYVSKDYSATGSVQYDIYQFNMVIQISK